MTRKRKRGCLQSQGSEDLFNAAKNHKLIKGKKRWRKAKKQYAAMISKKVVERIHKYDPVLPDVPVPKTAVLDDSVFQPDALKCTLPLEQLFPLKQNPPYFTCNAEGIGRPYHDIHMYNHVVIQGDATKVNKAWLGCLCQWSHNFVMREKPDGQWLLPLHHAQTSTVCVWPMTRRIFEHAAGVMYVEPEMTIDYPMFVCVNDLVAWEAMPFHWRSPTWQKEVVPSSASLPPGARRVIDGTIPASLLVVGAKRGFWKLDHNVLTDLANELDIVLPPGASKLVIATFLVMHVLTCDEQQALEYLKHRLAAFHGLHTCAKEFLEMEEVDEVLDPADVKVLIAERETLTTAIQDHETFTTEFTARARQLRLAKAKAAPKAKAKGKGKGKGKAAPVVILRPPVDFDIAQPDAKTYCPQGGSIWRNRLSGGWCSHSPPFIRFSASFKQFGQRESLRLNLVDLWEKFCVIRGYEASELPIQGILDSIPIVDRIDFGASGAASGSGG